MARQHCVKCTARLSIHDKGIFQCCICRKVFHMECDGINTDEQKVIDTAKDRQDTHLMASCTPCNAKYKLNTGLLFKDDPLVTSKNASYEKDINALKLQLANANEELNAARLNIEIVIKELNDSKATIEKNEKIYKDNLGHMQSQPSTSAAYTGFSQTDSIKAIQDLVTMQGKSMKWMTESFKKVVNVVSNLEKKIEQKTPKRVEEDFKLPQMSYAEALIKRNNVTGRSRNIAIAPGQNNDELLKQIRSDSAFNELSIDNIKKAQKNCLHVTLATPSEATKFESMFSSKYKGKVTINKVKDIKAKFKIVNVPMEINEQKFRKKIFECNKCIDQDTLTFDREYSSNQKTKNLVYKCSNNLLSLVIKKRMIRIDLEEYQCYDDFPLLQCFKCFAFGHTATTCTQAVACKICSGDHNHKDCSKLKPSCINCLRAETASGLIHTGKHRATAGSCPVRMERLRKVIDTLSKT